MHSIITIRSIICIILALMLFQCSSSTSDSNQESKGQKPRVIISTDIGGTDPDDFQSLIHYLMYANEFETEGIISSPYGEGRIKDIMDIIKLYESDFEKLKEYGDFPSPDNLRQVVKQGALNAAPYGGFSKATEGSEWIISKAREEDDRPLWVLIWGGLEDLAQALHDAPEIESKLKVYWIGGPNKKWSVNSYFYLASHFPNLFMIEANATYRGWFFDEDANANYKNDTFFTEKIKNQGAMGTDFINYYNGLIKMGDTPSMAYLLNGDPDNPEGESWGGSFSTLPYSSIRNFTENTKNSDTVPTYTVMQWQFTAEKFDLTDSVEIWLDIAGQRIDGSYLGEGKYALRFVPKASQNWSYTIRSTSPTLDQQKGEFVSSDPWPGSDNPQNLPLNNWWSDKINPNLFHKNYQGAKTISIWREDYLNDWATRLEWIGNN